MGESERSPHGRERGEIGRSKPSERERERGGGGGRERTSRRLSALSLLDVE